MTLPRLVGMVHLGPLPGAPRFGGSIQSVLDRAVVDASVLAETGFDAVIVENYGDEPFFADDVPKITVAAMTQGGGRGARRGADPSRCQRAPQRRHGGLGRRRGDRASFIRVNVLSGAMVTDQGSGPGSCRPGGTGPVALGGTAIWADVHVKHASRWARSRWRMPARHLLTAPAQTSSSCRAHRPAYAGIPTTWPESPSHMRSRGRR